MNGLLIRFLIGGTSVSLFALLGDLFRPKSFAGLFGAAPSVALATLALTVAKSGQAYAATEGLSMTVSAVALFVYASCVSRVMMRHNFTALSMTIAFLPVWAIAAFGLWRVLLR